MCNKPLNWLTFLLKLNTTDTYQSVDKVGKVAETLVLLYLPSSVILWNGHLFEKDARIFSNITDAKCSKYGISLEERPFLFCFDISFDYGEIPRYEKQLFAVK